MKRSLRVLELVALCVVLFGVAPGAEAKHGGNPQVIVIPTDGYTAVPNYPSVQYIPNGPLDVFQHNGRYYVWQNGWYVADKPGKPVVYINRTQVPRQVLLVPTQYYRLPPGQAKKLYGKPPHKPHHGHDDDD